MKSEFSSFLHHLRSLLTPFMALFFEARGSKAAYSSNDWVAWNGEKRFWGETGRNIGLFEADLILVVKIQTCYDSQLPNDETT